MRMVCYGLSQVNLCCLMISLPNTRGLSIITLSLGSLSSDVATIEIENVVPFSRPSV